MSDSTRTAESGHLKLVGWSLPPAIALLLLASFLRLYRAAERPLWGDEANTLFRARLPLPEMLQTLAYFDTHPPLTYLLLKPWVALLGESEASLRGFAAFWGILMLPLAWWVGREISGRAVGGWVAALLAATHPVLVFYAREGRGYTLLAGLGLASFAALLLALRTGRRRHWALYSLATAASLYTHNLAFLWLAWQAATVAAVAWHCRRAAPLRGFLLAQAGAYLLYLPWLVFFLTQFFSLAGGGSWISPLEPRMVLVSTLNYLGAASYLRLGDMRPSLDQITSMLLMGPLLLLYAGARGLPPPQRWQALGLTTLPIAVLATIAAVVSVYVDRGVIVTAVGLCVISAGAVRLSRSRYATLLTTAALLLTLALHLRGFATYLQQPVDDFRSLAMDLASATRAGDTVVFLPWFGSDATRYYLEDLPVAARLLANERDVDPPGGLQAHELARGAVWIVRVPAPPPASAVDLPERLEQAGLKRVGTRFYPDRLLSLELYERQGAGDRGLAWTLEEPMIVLLPR